MRRRGRGSAPCGGDAPCLPLALALTPSPSPPSPHPLALTLALAFTRTRTRTLIRTLTKAMRPAAFRVRMRDGCGNAVPSVADPESPTGEPLPMRLQLTPGLKGQRTAVEDAGGGEG